MRISVFPRSEKISAVVDGTNTNDEDKTEAVKAKKSEVETYIEKREKRDKKKQNLQLKYSLN